MTHQHSASSKGLSYAFKLVVFVGIVGITITSILGVVQQRNAKKQFTKYFQADLQDLSLTSRLLFDTKIKNFHHLAKMIRDTKSTFDYLTKNDLNSPAGIKYFTMLPPWLQTLKHYRKSFLPNYALLLNSQNQIKQIYHGNEDIPSFLLNLDPFIVEQAQEQVFITTLSGQIYIIVGEKLAGYNGKVMSMLFLKPIDTLFLQFNNLYQKSDQVLALLTEDRKEVLVSSDINQIPEGSKLEKLRNEFFISGEAFMDYGATDVALIIVSLKSKKEIKGIVSTYTAESLKNILFSFLAFLFGFWIIFMRTSHRVRQLGLKVEEFSQKELLTSTETAPLRDELLLLENRFNQLMENVISYKRSLIKSSEEKEEIQSQLIQSAKMASLGILSSGVAHELANPVMSIMGYCHRIKKKSIEDLSIELAEKINNQAIRMRSIVDHMRTHARQSKKEDLAPLNYNEPIESALILLEPMLKKVSIQLELQLTENLPYSLGDKVQLESVYQNLMVNSMYAFKELEEEREFKIQIITSLTSDYHIKVDYKDNAGGMPDEVVKKIFDPFFTTKGSGEGTGLGMSIAKGIIKNHQGTISVNSTLGEGTQFQLLFEIKDQSDENLS